jgi:D-methionine transport system substrate-binding protein
MKKNLLKTTTVVIAMLLLGLLTFACQKDTDNGGDNGNNGGGDGNGNNGGDDTEVITGYGTGPLTVTITKGISHTEWEPGQTGKVTFTRFPNSVAEFKTVREQIGEEPHGAVALLIMASEMYRRHNAVGETCMRLTSTKSYQPNTLSKLKQVYGNDAGYARPHQMAYFLKDATPENGYNPSKPYTIEVQVSKGVEYIYSNDYQTYVIKLEIFTNSKDDGLAGITVMQTKKPDESSEDGKYFLVHESSSVFMSGKAMAFGTTWNGLE